MISRSVAILGSTGSIGTQTLAVVEALNRAGHNFSVVALSAGKNLELVAAQVQRFRPSLLAIERSKDFSHLRRLLAPHWNGEIIFGGEGLRAVATFPEADLVVNGLVGAAGLIPTLEALKANKTLALANKESLVIGGHLVKRILESGHGRLIPVDSEHSAIFQLLQECKISEVERIILTASGGPLRTKRLGEFETVTVAEVLSHPTWQMGKRITVDSTTLVNKAFEVIEAHWLFGLHYDKISVLIHPQSVVHGLVELTDGSLLAHLGVTEMRLPIQYALTYPERAPSPGERLDLIKQKLEFASVGKERYPAFWLVCEAGRQGGTLPAVANAADEILVQRFLNGELVFPQIARGLDIILAEHAPVSDPPLGKILEADAWARKRASNLPVPASKTNPFLGI